MFPRRYFTARYFTARYYPLGGSNAPAVEVVAAGGVFRRAAASAVRVVRRVGASRVFRRSS